MGNFGFRLPRFGTSRTRRNRCRPALTPLEGRQLNAIITGFPTFSKTMPGVIVSTQDTFPVTATPNYLLPTGRLVPVTVTGKFLVAAKAITDQTPGPNHGNVLYVLPDKVYANFRVIDEYRKVEPRGPVVVTPGDLDDSNPQDPNYQKNLGIRYYNFSFTTYLPASRSTYVVDGRHYYITVAAEDSDNGGSKTVAVYVAHGPGQGTQST